MSFPVTRLRRLRKSESLRRLVRETSLAVDDLILPLFIRRGKGIRRPIGSMPGQFQLSVDQAVREVKESKKLGIPAVILFGIPDKKDDLGSESYDPEGIIQVAIREIKDQAPGMIVIADCCFCEYTSHGHCGIIKKSSGQDGFVLDNDATLEVLAKAAVSQAESGADVIAPSGMVDGMVKTIRSALDENGFSDRAILAYSAKYASAFYGPFRDAAEGKPQFGDRKSYQMDTANFREALREVAQDIKEGADMVMVKPALSYLDIVGKVKDRYNLPVAA
ncbi:MAG: porphobilinogen synthase [Elusimicrobia bacterium]|nr:porphobilinogen synthase [Elusimicrobiota bacterium]